MKRLGVVIVSLSINHRVFCNCMSANFIDPLFLCRLFWLVIALEVLVSLMHWSIFRIRSQKLFSSVLQWCLMVRGLLMCLLKRYIIIAYLLSSHRIYYLVIKLVRYSVLYRLNFVNYFANTLINLYPVSKMYV